MYNVAMNKKIVFEEKPEGFDSVVKVVTSYLEYENKFLILRYTDAKSKLWTAPGGKVEAGEATVDAFHRELHEETGIILRDVSDAIALKTLYFQYGDVSYECYPFHVQLSKKPEVLLSAEHEEYTWTSLNDAIQNYTLIPGAKQGISIHFSNAVNYGI